MIPGIKERIDMAGWTFFQVVALGAQLLDVNTLESLIEKVCEAVSMSLCL